MKNQETDGTPGKDGRRGRALGRVELPDVVAWPEPVDGKTLLDALVRELNRFLVFPKWAAEMLALWIVHTYAYHLRDVTTYVAIESPEKECGKSTLLILLSRFVNRPALSSNISSSAFFHAVEDLEPTLLIDEGDTNLRARRELRGIFNGGYTKATAFVWRVIYEAEGENEGEGKAGSRGAGVRSSRGTLVRYSVWCPKAIASIGRLDETLASRCVVIGMQRKMEGEECERLKRINAEELKQQCARFVLDHAPEIAKAEPLIPKGLTNRAADVWEPLFVLADLAGGQWPELARNAAEGLTGRTKGHSPIGALLLDLLMVFLMNGKDRLFTRDILELLNNGSDRPWGELRRGKEVNEIWLARQLRPYEVGPRTIRIGEQVAKGYVQEDFKEVFKRYIPRAQVDLLKEDLALRVEANKEARALANANEGDLTGDNRGAGDVTAK